MRRTSYNESWWLMSCDFPNLNWARLCVFDSGNAEILDSDGKTHIFNSEQQAINWLLEDEHISYEKIDKEDEREYGIRLSLIKPPVGQTVNELKGNMYIKVNRV